jgi:hypothetical protein
MESSLSFDDQPLKGSSISLDDEYPPASTQPPIQYPPFIEEGDRPIVAKPSQFSDADAFGVPEAKGIVLFPRFIFIYLISIHSFIHLYYYYYYYYYYIIIINKQQKMVLLQSIIAHWMCD